MRRSRNRRRSTSRGTEPWIHRPGGPRGRAGRGHSAALGGAQGRASARQPVGGCGRCSVSARELQRVRWRVCWREDDSGIGNWRRGPLVTGGGWATPPPPACGRSGAAAHRQVRNPETGPARGTRRNGPRADEPRGRERTSPPGRRRQAAIEPREAVVASCGDGAWPPPSPAVGLYGQSGTRQERLRRPPDRAKPARPLTEPVPPGFWRLSGEGGGVVSGHRGRRGRCPAVQQRNTATYARSGYRDRP
jgi:hypothetical protein